MPKFCLANSFSRKNKNRSAPPKPRESSKYKILKDWLGVLMRRKELILYFCIGSMACQILFNFGLQATYDSNYFPKEKIPGGFWKSFGDAAQKIKNCQEIVASLQTLNRWPSGSGDLFEYVLLAVSPAPEALRRTSEIINILCRGILVVVAYMILMPHRKWALLVSLYVALWPSLYLFSSQVLRDTLLLTVFSVFLLLLKYGLQGSGLRKVTLVVFGLLCFSLIYDLRVYTAVFVILTLVLHLMLS